MLREFCQVTDSRSIFVYQSMQEKLPVASSLYRYV